MSFADFMQQALYHPQYGYYHQTRELIGAKGDFITAPEISPIFSQCMANAILSILDNQHQSLASCSILELGAGNGTMAFDMLSHWHAQGNTPDNYQILELSDTLKKRQQQKLSSLPPAIRQRIEWIDRLPSKPKQRIILANEVLDALPCNVGKTKYLDGAWHWCERQVSCEKGGLQWCEAPPTRCLPAEIHPSYCLEGRVIEIPQKLSPWLRALRKIIKSGFFLIMDYADYDKALQHTHPHGTLRCYQAHQVHGNPFIHIGQQDITYHLNIDLLATQLKQAGWQLDTLETQAHFLFQNGLQDTAMMEKHKTQRWQLSKQIQQLTSPTEMGERYKVMRCH